MGDTGPTIGSRTVRKRFSVKWLVQAQIDSTDELNFDPDAGPIQAPWVGWGPYLWADGAFPRADGLSWNCSDFARAGTHPARSGVDKVPDMLLDFVHTDPSASEWYLADP